jgi:transcriptional regulator with XRE-family HTH domain
MVARKSGNGLRRACAEDIAVAHRLRVFRLERGLSQNEVARQAGVSFQQFQKYEKAENRISAGRLLRIATALRVSVAVFYDGAERLGEEDGFTYLRTRGALRLVRAYAGVSTRQYRVVLVALAEALAKTRAARLNPPASRRT